MRWEGYGELDFISSRTALSVSPTKQYVLLLLSLSIVQLHLSTSNKVYDDADADVLLTFTLPDSQGILFLGFLYACL